MRRLLVPVFILVAMVAAASGNAQMLLPVPGQTLSSGGHLKMHRVVTVDSASPDSSVTVSPSGQLRAKSLMVSGALQSGGAITSPSMSVTGTVSAGSLSVGGTTITATPAQLNLISQVLQPGLIMMWPTSTPPSGWLVCDGSAVSRSMYPALFSVVGTSFGNGDGSTTFNLPNMKGRQPVGYDAGDASFNSMGKTGGEKSHTLSVREMPSHNHTQTAHSHGLHGYQTTSLGGSPAFTSNSTLGYGADFSTTSVAPAIDYSGGGNSHNVMDPYFTLTFIVKY